MKLALCNKTFESLPLHEFLDLAASVGFNGVELGPQTLGLAVETASAAELRAIRRQAETRGLGIVALNSIFQDTAGLDLVPSDSTTKARSSARLRALAPLAAELGAHTIVVGSPRQRRAPDGMPFEQSANLFLEALMPACDVAAQLGVTFSLEPLEQRLTNFMNDTDEAIALITRAQHPALALLLDVKQMAVEIDESEFATLIVRGAPWLRHFHANDANRQAPGEGATDFTPIFRALSEVDYTGWVSIEAFAFRGDPLDDLRRSRAYLVECQRLVGIE